MELDQLIEKVTAELMKEFRRESQVSQRSQLSSALQDLQGSQPSSVPQDLQGSQPSHTSQDLQGAQPSHSLQDLQGMQSSPASQTSCASQEVARFIDHTLLKPDATREQIIRLCEEARDYCFASVCVNPTNVSLASSFLKDTPVKVCTVIGFPLGANTSVTKAIETRDAIVNGASEVDMVINVGALKSGDHNQVTEDIEAVVDAARGKALVKVILETALLTDEEKVKGCLLAKLAGADFVKTSTGFGPGGATVEDVRLMRKVVGPDMGVKASGGIRDYEATRRMVEAGANRIGASAGVKIVKQAKESESR